METCAKFSRLRESRMLCDGAVYWLPTLPMPFRRRAIGTAPRLASWAGKV